MTRYLTEAEAQADGFHITHQPDAQRFVLTRGEEVLGEAHYRIGGDDLIDFNHTVVVPELRGTGLAQLLAHRAVTDEVTSGRTKVASCSFIAAYLRKHPAL